MKKYIFLATALAALVSCSENEFVGDENITNTSQNEQGAIAFGTGLKAVTRSDKTGADAAKLLNNKFIVGGFKGNGTTMTKVFDNYIVQWAANTAGKTTSNTSDWEYVGITAAVPSAITGSQTIKYWDYAASQYDFAAFSTGDIPAAKVKTSGTAGSGEVVISGISAANTYAGPTYVIKGAATELAKCYISDLVTAYNPADFQKEVQFKFRNLATKVRVALYETVPGYSVKQVKFYTNDATTLTTGASATSATLYAPNTGTTDVFYTKGTATVSFPTIGSTKTGETDYNKAHVTIAPLGEGSSETQSFGTLNYTGKHDREADGSYLAITSANPTFAGTATDNYYTTALPNETGTVLKLRVDYTLVATDGSGEEIKIHGATAYVPAIYAAWKSNYAYTYIFKISDNTNGWTSTVDTDPAGLFPITFDAVVVDAEEHTQSTITTVATPSITTYQKGHDYSAQETYKAGDIYVQVMTGTTLESNLGTKGFLYTLSNAAATEAEVMDAISIQEATIANPPATITGRNSLVLTNAASSMTVTGITTIPGADGNNITVTEGTAAKITATANTYAYIYDTGTYNGIYLGTKPTGWPTGYYTENTCTTAATGDFAAGTFYQPSSEIRSYMVLSSAPSDWNASANVYYSDEACTTPINSDYANPSASYTTKPADWPTGYYTESTCTTAATDDGFTASTPYYKKLTCYKKFTVNNKIYGVKVIKVVD